MARGPRPAWPPGGWTQYSSSSIRSPPSRTTRALLRVCNVHNVPVAMNLANADLIIAGLCCYAGATDPARIEIR
ncbi:MAG: hypothetical protein ACREJE_11970 [Candidatus Rokuibacteriota bacterium]